MSVPARVMQQDLPVDPPEYRYTDGEIVSMLRDEVVASSGDTASLINQQREDAYQAYYGEYPEPLPGVASSHRSRDVLDSVESIKSKLLRTFTSSRSPVYFESTGKWDVEGAEIATDAVKTIFYRENEGYRLLQWSLHDALLTKACVFKVSYQKRKERIPESFEDVPCESVYALAGREDVEVAEITAEKLLTAALQTPYGTIVRQKKVCSGVVYRIEDTSGVVVDVIPPENFGVPQNVRVLRETGACWERHEYTRSELVGMGFDPEVVETLSGNDLTANNSLLQGRYALDGAIQPNTAKNERMLIPTYEVYLKIDMDGDDEAELWQFILAGSTLLSKERVRKMPYYLWSPFMLSHKIIGMGIADVTIDTQRTSSNIVRGAVDNIYRTNNPTRTANMSGGVIKNPQDLINNPPGLIIDTSDPASVTALQQPGINPATFNVLEIIRQEKESRTGMSRLAQGLNADAVSNQNAEDMIAALMNASNERVLEMARSFAECVLKPLFEDIYQLAGENGQIVEMSRKGQLQQVGMDKLGYRPNMTVSVALTDEEIARRAQTLVGLHGLMSNDPQIAPLYGLQERYGLFAALFDLAGYSSAFLANPSDPEVQKKLAMNAQQQAQEKAKAEALAVAPLKLQQQAVQGDLALKKEKLDFEAAKQADEQTLDEQKFHWDQRVDIAEYAIERTQRRPASIGVNP